MNTTSTRADVDLTSAIARLTTPISTSMRSIVAVLRLGVTAILAVVAATSAAAQVRPQIRDSVVLKREAPTTRVLTKIAPAPASAPAPISKAPPPPTATAAGVSGLEVVAGPYVDVASLAVAGASAQCPSGKVALSTGVDFTANGDASYGLEVRGAWPDGRLGTVSVRNANVAVPARVRALVVCVTEIAGLRAAYFGGVTGSGDNASNADGACSATERVVGGGVMGRSATVVAVNAPDQRNGGGVWRQGAMPASPARLPGTYGVESRVLCAPANAVDGWELATSVPVSLGARSQTTLSAQCPAGKVLLAAGVLQSSGNYLDLIANTLLPNANGSVTAQLRNRNTLGTGGTVDAKVTAICARRA